MSVTPFQTTGTKILDLMKDFNFLSDDVGKFFVLFKDGNCQIMTQGELSVTPYIKIEDQKIIESSKEGVLLDI